MKKSCFFLALTINAYMAPATLVRAPKPKHIERISTSCFVTAILQSLYCTSLLEYLAQCHPPGTMSGALYEFFFAYSSASSDTVPSAAYMNLIKFFQQTPISDTDNTLIFGEINGKESLYRDISTIIMGISNYLTKNFAKCNKPNPFRTEFRQITLNEHRKPQGSKSTLLIETIFMGQTLEQLFATQPYQFEGHTLFQKKFILNASEIFTIDTGVAKESFEAKTFDTDLDLNTYRNPNNDKNAKYTLVAVILYSLAGGGHYANFSCINDVWYFCDEWPTEGTASITQLAKGIGSIGKTGIFTVGQGPHQRIYIPKLLFYQRNDTIKTGASASLTSDLLTLSGQLHNLGDSI
jgi:hypothetical protein